MGGKRVRVGLAQTGEIIADGPIGWGVTPFEGNYYIARRYLRSDGFRANFIPGLCFYKFLYVWLDYVAADGTKIRNLGWRYWLPNPLLPFIWFRVAVPSAHPELRIEEYEAA